MIVRVNAMLKPPCTQYGEPDDRRLVALSEELWALESQARIAVRVDVAARWNSCTLSVREATVLLKPTNPKEGACRESQSSCKAK